MESDVGCHRDDDDREADQLTPGLERAANRHDRHVAPNKPIDIRWVVVEQIEVMENQRISADRIEDIEVAANEDCDET